MRQHLLRDFTAVSFKKNYERALYLSGYYLNIDILNQTIIVRLTPNSNSPRSFQAIKRQLESPFNGFPVYVFLSFGNLLLNPC